MANVSKITVDSTTYDIKDTTARSDITTIQNDYVKSTDNYFNYSTSEKAIGKWINGETLYRKVITGTTASSSSPTSIGTISNIDNVINIYGTLTYYQQRIPLTFVYNNEQNAVYIENGSVMVRATASSYQNKSCFVVVEYTKTV